MELVPLDRILMAIRHKTDKKVCPQNEPATSWREPRLLKAVAENYCRFVLVPSMVDAWSKAGLAPQKPVDAPKPFARRRIRKRASDAPAAAQCTFR